MTIRKPSRLNCVDWNVNMKRPTAMKSTTNTWNILCNNNKQRELVALDSHTHTHNLIYNIPTDLSPLHQLSALPDAEDR